MRLSDKELRYIKQAFNSVLGEESYEIYLFGSRIDDTKLGGDIDLLVIVGGALKRKVIDLKAKIKNEIFKNIDEQKIDITVATPEEMKVDVFLKSISLDLVRLK